MRSACSSRRSPASFVAVLALALLWFAGGARAEAEQVPAAGFLEWPRVAVRAKPDLRARKLVVWSQFRRDFRPRVVFALGLRRNDDGKPAWYRISIPGRPNGRTGWIPAESVTLEPVRKEIRIDLSARRLEVRRGRRLELRTRVAVGAPGMTTPVGYYFVAAKIPRPRYPALGVYAFETSAYSSLSDWPGGGIVGIHGTPMPWLLGQAVSHGCVRVENSVIQRMSRLVPLGTPIRIVR